MEQYGEYFFQYCIDSGYDRLLRVLGGNLHDFLSNLDALHDHLSSIYPGMQAPSFRCHTADDGTLALHYHSSRNGYEGMVKGIVKVVAREFFDSNVTVSVLPKQDHTVLTIKEESYTTLLVRKRSSSLVSHLHRARSSTNPRDFAMSTASFCKAFPFHVIFDRHLEIVQAGVALLRVMKVYRKRRKRLFFNEVFDIVRPVTNSSFDDILHHIHTVFIALTKPGVIHESRKAPQGSGTKTTTTHEPVIMRLKGQMIFIAEIDSIVFLCSPRVNDIEDLRSRGLYLSDIPIHDATRDLILIAQARRAEHELVEKLEETSNNLKKLQTRLQEDKQRTDELLLSILPYGVAERLRLNQAVDAEKYPLVTILFSDIVGFTAMCGNEKVVPMDIVRLLNKLYTQFDVLSNIHEVYKVETIGDAYMVVGGMPELTEKHADNVAAMAVGMMQASDTVLSPVENSPIQIRIGIHSGPCVAGVVGQKMPRYCLFGNTVTVASQMEGLSSPGRINISITAKEYLTKPENYEFEENKTKSDISLGSYYMVDKASKERAVPVDLGLPVPRGMFRTPNPSPAASPNTSPTAVTPCDEPSPSSSPKRLNSPESTLPKFKMPSIHICDADEEAHFRSSLHMKMSQMMRSSDGDHDGLVSPSSRSDFSPARDWPHSFSSSVSVAHSDDEDAEDDSQKLKTVPQPRRRSMPPNCARHFESTIRNPTESGSRRSHSALVQELQAGLFLASSGGGNSKQEICEVPPDRAHPDSCYSGSALAQASFRPGNDEDATETPSCPEEELFGDELAEASVSDKIALWEERCNLTLRQVSKSSSPQAREPSRRWSSIHGYFEADGGTRRRSTSSIPVEHSNQCWPYLGLTSLDTGSASDQQDSPPVSENTDAPRCPFFEITRCGHVEEQASIIEELLKHHRNQEMYKPRCDSPRFKRSISETTSIKHAVPGTFSPSYGFTDRRDKLSDVDSVSQNGGSTSPNPTLSSESPGTQGPSHPLEGMDKSSPILFTSTTADQANESQVSPLGVTSNGMVLSQRDATAPVDGTSRNVSVSSPPSVTCHVSPAVIAQSTSPQKPPTSPKDTPSRQTASTAPRNGERPQTLTKKHIRVSDVNESKLDEYKPSSQSHISMTKGVNNHASDGVRQRGQISPVNSSPKTNENLLAHGDETNSVQSVPQPKPTTKSLFLDLPNDGARNMRRHSEGNPSRGSKSQENGRLVIYFKSRSRACSRSTSPTPSGDTLDMSPLNMVRSRSRESDSLLSTPSPIDAQAHIDEKRKKSWT